MKIHLEDKNYKKTLLRMKQKGTDGKLKEVIRDVIMLKVSNESN